MKRPNGLRISRRERTTQAAKKPMISRAKRSAATACSATGSPSCRLPPACADHTCMVPHRQNGLRSGITPSIESHPAQRASIWNHIQQTITLSITGVQYNEPSNHTCTTGNQHNERSYHACTTGARTTGSAQRAFQKPDSPHPNRIRNADHTATGAERLSSAARWMGLIDCGNILSLL
jgi:hypothetical protein